MQTEDGYKVFNGVDECIEYLKSQGIWAENINEPLEAIDNPIRLDNLSRPERRRLEKALLKASTPSPTKVIKRTGMGVSPYSRIERGDKYDGLCAKHDCNRGFARIWNHGSRKWYCMRCGLKLNQHNPEFKKANGHDMCQYRGKEHPEWHDLDLRLVARKLREEERAIIQRQHQEEIDKHKEA